MPKLGVNIDHVATIREARKIREPDPIASEREHVILLSDANLGMLLRELGLDEQLNWRTTRTGFFTDGRLHSLSNVMDFLTFGPLSLIDKGRLALTILYASRVKDWPRLDLP